MHADVLSAACMESRITCMRGWVYSEAKQTRERDEPDAKGGGSNESGRHERCTVNASEVIYARRGCQRIRGLRKRVRSKGTFERTGRLPC